MNPLMRGKYTGPHDAAVGERLAVAVLVVGPGLVEVVVDERDGARCRSGTACPTATAAAPRRSNACSTDVPHERSSPAWWISSKTTNAPRRQRRQRPRRRRDLLVGGDDAVHVGRQHAVAGRPLGVEVQAEAQRGLGPLVLQVLGRRHHHHAGGRGARPGPAPRRSARTSSCRRPASRRPGSRSRSVTANASSASDCQGRSRMRVGRMAAGPPAAVAFVTVVRMWVTARSSGAGERLA